jgi:hypothetical protein
VQRTSSIYRSEPLTVPAIKRSAVPRREALDPLLMDLVNAIAKVRSPTRWGRTSRDWPLLSTLWFSLQDWVARHPQQIPYIR